MRDRLVEKRKLIQLIRKGEQELWNKKTHGIKVQCEDFADYLLANGVIVPPCKVGDKIYMPWEFDGINGIARLTVLFIKSDVNGTYIKTDLDSDAVDYLEKYNFGVFESADIVKTVFLTREEAEVKLKEGVR